MARCQASAALGMAEKAKVIFSQDNAMGRPFETLLAIPFLLMASTVNAVLPDLLCQELKAALVDPVTLRTNEITELRTLYRFNSSSLFLSSPDRSEYLYNKVQQMEQRRFSSGLKTFIFDETFRRGLQVHIYVDEVRISQMSCNELKRQK